MTFHYNCVFAFTNVASRYVGAFGERPASENLLIERNSMGFDRVSRKRVPAGERMEPV